MAGAKEDKPVRKKALLRRGARRAERLFFRGVIDSILPVVSRLGAGKVPVRHTNIPYHDHEDVRMHLDVFVPATPGPHPVLVSFHGGGWVLGRRHNLVHAAYAFARQGFVVFNCSYRLAPKFQLPASLQDAQCAMRWVADHAHEYGGDASRVGVWGDSAGGHLSAMMAVGQHVACIAPVCSCSPAKAVPVKAAVHFYGVFDFERFLAMPISIIRNIARAALGERADDAEFLRWISPYYQAREGQIPATLILCGDRDPLIGQSVRYARRLNELGGDATLRIYRGALHGFMNAWWTPAGKDSLRLATEHFQTHLMPERGRRAA